MQKLILPMKVHIEILPHNNKADTDLAIMWSFYLEQGIILAYCPRILLEDKKQCQEESEKIRSTLALHLK